MTVEPNFVVVELQGRLGNQLFQFASGYAVARRSGARLRFVADRVRPEDLLLPRLVGTAYVEANPSELLRVGAWPDRGRSSRLLRSGAFHLTRGLRRFHGRSMPSFVVWSNTGRFRPEVFDLDLPVRLVGHLQSERYFAEYAGDVFRLLEFPPSCPSLPPSARATVGVSFRRGDYNALDWALPLTYYDRALDVVAERVGEVRVVLFGDDAAFVELAGDRFRRYGEVVDALAVGADPISQLHVMSSCDHFVLSNSSFAWWGAWLGDQHELVDRIVVAPAEFGGGDRMPARWITIPSGVASF